MIKVGVFGVGVNCRGKDLSSERVLLLLLLIKSNSKCSSLPCVAFYLLSSRQLRRPAALGGGSLCGRAQSSFARLGDCSNCEVRILTTVISLGAEVRAQVTSHLYFSSFEIKLEMHLFDLFIET